MPRVHFVHGILDPLGTSWLLNLVPYFKAAGFDCRVPDYGLITAVETRIVNPLIERALKPYMEPGDIYVGHSNGCAIGYDLMRGGCQFAAVAFINAALERQILVTPPTKLFVYFNQGDLATEAAVIGESLGLVSPVWGEMGHSGYEGTSRLVTNVNCSTPPDGLPLLFGHSDMGTPGKLARWAPRVLADIQSALNLSPNPIHEALTP